MFFSRMVFDGGWRHVTHNGPVSVRRLPAVSTQLGSTFTRGGTVFRTTHLLYNSLGQQVREDKEVGEEEDRPSEKTKGENCAGAGT